MSKTPAAYMARIVANLYSTAINMLSKEETTVTATPTLYGHTLVEQYCDRHKIKDFFGPYSNTLGRVRTYVETNLEDYEQATYRPLVLKYEGFTTIKSLGKPLKRFLDDHLDKKDYDLFMGLHMGMKHLPERAETVQEDLEDAFETIKAFAGQIKDPRLRDAMRFDLDKLKIIMENAIELGDYEFWEKYLQVSRVLAQVLTASYGATEFSFPAKLIEYIKTARMVQYLATGLPTLVGLGADATTLLDNVKKLA